MEKILIIIKREYWTRVRKPSFIIMSFLGPLLFGALLIVPTWLTTLEGDQKKLQVIDESGFFKDKLIPYENLTFVPVEKSLEAAKDQVVKGVYDGLLHVPKFSLDAPEGIKLYSEKSISAFMQTQIEGMLKKEIEKQKLIRSGLTQATLDSVSTKLSLSTISLSEKGESNSNSMAASVIGYFSAFMIYFFIFLFGMQVFRGVMEEKTNRIVEIIISSVKPFQLMMGKIIGIAGVALTQFLLWVVLSFAVSTVATSLFQIDRFSNAQLDQTLKQMKNPEEIQNAMEINEVLSAIESVNVPLVVGCLLFYFLFSYLLYGALFGAIGSAVDSETDSQQFMMPITMPILASIMISMAVIKEPDSSLAFWTSIFPLSSPIVMMVRIPFGVPVWELVLSMVLLVLGFIGSVWVASRIYRIGILMYGKKVTFKEIGRWIFFKG
ncbi:MAG: ABC transporter permease [Cytophagales bacterium]|nr:MAG: ABC transporter permease [Cytophagales bacterium]TAF62129.1 MAG: ABC transporter permease [Cytophagales bacterium]